MNRLCVENSLPRFLGHPTFWPKNIFSDWEIMKILSTLLARLRQDCHGFIVSTELMLLGSIVFFGLIAAFAATREAVISELSDVAGFSQDFNQSFSYNGATGASGVTAGSDYLDQLDVADDAEDLAGQADNGILFNAAPLDEFVAASAPAAFSTTSTQVNINAFSGGSSTDTIDLSSFGIAIGDTVTVSNVLADGDLNSPGETFTLNFNSGEFTTAALQTGIEINGSLTTVSPSVSQTITVIDIGSGVPGIQVTAQATSAVNNLGFPALSYTVDISGGGTP